ncbi:hypothetical protein SmJEL517_g03906 [Synchytrium microbalum]|uniref:sphinganine-1-phosphate aldolase n=1 Tax=Synchytrium microbalum TaxID=1806994 RepID=A0A507C6H1_9FUNG|nr:uncharacterized protein SmJEL517_g03906 [Synchytrium microbalum]TPX33075.1 hypothetical protein SmJEL517_g03906 [Synchytrium microbalum]
MEALTQQLDWRKRPLVTLLVAHAALVYSTYLLNSISHLFGSIRRDGIVGSLQVWAGKLIQDSILLVRRVPLANNAVNDEVAKIVKGLEDQLAPKVEPGELEYLALPSNGLNDTQVRKELDRYERMGLVKWQEGTVSGAIFSTGFEFGTLLQDTFGKFSGSNPLHPAVFPGVRRMESEIVQMVLRMYNAPGSAAGSVSSGGTESLLLAVKTYRDLAKAERGILKPNMVLPRTIHAAFDKAAEYFNVEIIYIPVDTETGQVNLAAMRSAINSNTIMIAGSAPNWPHGIIDDIPKLSALALQKQVPLHVDACLGGFIVPFVEKAGFALPYVVDFRNEGVTSISCDSHKYGLAPKGTSIIMYRSKQIRKYQYFVSTEWPGGVYASPSIPGSRSGALIATCWVSMLRIGEDGYVKLTRDILQTQCKIKETISSIPTLKLIGDPILMVVTFTTTKPGAIFGILAELDSKGWHLNAQQKPAAIQIACTSLTVQCVDKLCSDIRDAADRVDKDPSLAKSESASIYSAVNVVPDRTIIRDIAIGFVDTLTKV